MHGLLKMLIGASLGKALNGAPAHTEEHTAEFAAMLKRIQSVDPAKLRGMVFVAVEDAGDGAMVHNIATGDSQVIEVLMQAAQAEFLADDMRRSEREAAAATADTCECSNCQLRRALVGRGLGQDLGDGVAVVLNVGGSIEDIIKEATRKAN